MDDDGKKMPSFYDRISEDHDIKRYTDKILNNLKKGSDGKLSFSLMVKVL